MLVLLAAIVVGGAVSLWLLLGGNGGSPKVGTTPSTGAVVPATRAQAVRLVHAFVGARIHHRTVDAYVTRKLASQYRAHTGGIRLYAYRWDDRPPADITGYSIFHVEKLPAGDYVIALDLKMGDDTRAVREEILLLGPGKNTRGSPERLVVRQAQLPKV